MKQNKSFNINRRLFLKNSTLTLGAYVLPTFSIAQPGISSNSKLNIAIIGAGLIGRHALTNLKSENIVAICDVDRGYAQPAINNHPKAKYYNDFRKMFDEMDNEIDAVIVATPDHAHFHTTMVALSLGKHVYLEKPLAHKVEEIRMLQQRAKRAQVITQMGNQGHSSNGIRLVKEWYEAGILGEVREVHAWTNTPVEMFFMRNLKLPLKAEKVIKDLDWDLWLGPAKQRFFNNAYVRTTWRGWWDFGTGMIGDNMPHTVDAPFWALGLGSPSEVTVELDGQPNAEYTPFGARVKFYFPQRGDQPPVVLHWYQGKPNAPVIKSIPQSAQLQPRGMLMVGNKNTLYAPGLQATSPRILDENVFNELKRDPVPQTIPRIKGNSHQEWVKNIKNNQPSSSDFEYGGSLSELGSLGALVIQTGKSIQWDPERAIITNYPELTPLLRHHPRKNWDYRKV